jgi:hypothetical protein
MKECQKQCKFTDVTLILKDLNVKVGNTPDGETVGKLGLEFSLDTQNERGETSVQCCKARVWFKCIKECQKTIKIYRRHPHNGRLKCKSFKHNRDFWKVRTRHTK